MNTHMVTISSMLLLACVLVLTDASAFLEAITRDSDFVAKSEVEESLLEELSGLSHAGEVSRMEAELNPMFVALPKTESGKLEPATVRYALHRYFVQKHGWYMSGLEPAGGAWNSTSPTGILKDRAPAYIQSLLETRVHGSGLGLHELAVFAATLADLVHKEAASSLYKVFKVLRLPTAGPVTRKQADAAIKAYMVEHLLGGNASFSHARDFGSMQEELARVYPAWQETYTWVKDLRESRELSQQPLRNPFVKHEENFAGAMEFVREVGHKFGSFQNLECRALKTRLAEMEHQGTGRVRLSRFYAGGLEGDWTFTESMDYLRSLGALDERDATRPSVVIPNYMSSQTNCLTSSGFYSVCCLDECEDLLQHLEMGIGAPSADPKRILDLVAALPSESVDAPRNLSSSLGARLNEISEFHGGHVPLYGRLFSQWMHHAYPRECPFPHVTGTTNPMSPEEWMEEYGEEKLVASESEMERHLAQADGAGEEAEDLPWMAVEELIAEYAPVRQSTLWASLRAPAAVLALALVAKAIWQSSAALLATSTEGSKPESLLV